MTADAAEIVRLADAVAKAKRTENTLDVLCEVALFEPDAASVSVRANAAGTKVIYTNRDASEETCWAQNWTTGANTRAETVMRLRARAASALSDGEG